MKYKYISLKVLWTVLFLVLNYHFTVLLVQCRNTIYPKPNFALHYQKIEQCPSILRGLYFPFRQFMFNKLANKKTRFYTHCTL